MRDLKNVPRGSFVSTVYRVVRTGVDPLSTRGSELNGGRYHAPGTPDVLYASLERDTATAEVIRGLRARGIRPQDYGPKDWWIYEIKLKGTKVLDLTDRTLLQTLGISATDLIAPDVAVTRQIAKQAFEAGFEAILAPSAAHPGKNVVIFLKRLSPAPSVTSSAPIQIS